jgi:tRNA/tmRNA/rRNA uracil-C5-methylase (TrmA/RlmC/RlmD family)
LAKELALQKFWESMVRPGTPLDKLVPSPLGRNYRTLSKRRWTKTALCLLERNIYGRLEPWKIALCDVEPAEHARIFAYLGQQLRHSPITKGLRFAVVRGNYKRFTLLLNIENLDHGALNRLTKALTAPEAPPLHSIFAFRGAHESDYYLEQAQANDRLHRLHGPTWQKVDIAGKHFAYHPLSFCQVNQALTGELVESVGLMLGHPELPMLDLYCGFGLFSLGLGRSGPVLGVEANPWSVRSARENAKNMALPITVGAARREVDFLARELNGESMQAIMKRWKHKDFVAVLDPPRGGPATGVIDTLAAYAPRRVVHLVCDIERTGTELTQWKDCGYRLERAVPFDMFPGTNDVELALVLTRTQGAAGQPGRSAQKKTAKGISLRMSEKTPHETKGQTRR